MRVLARPEHQPFSCGCCKTGRCYADMAFGIDSIERRAIESQPKPDKLPLPPFFPLAANTFMQWKEWRAGKEF